MKRRSMSGVCLFKVLCVFTYTRRAFWRVFAVKVFRF